MLVWPVDDENWLVFQMQNHLRVSKEALYFNSARQKARKKKDVIPYKVGIRNSSSALSRILSLRNGEEKKVEPRRNGKKGKREKEIPNPEWGSKILKAHVDIYCR